MGIRFLFIIILIGFFSSCKNGTKYEEKYSLVPDEERIEIEITKHSKNYSKCIQYMSVNDSNYFLMQNDTRNSIEIYNLDTKRLYKEIIIKIEGPNSFCRIIGFIAKNMDTIIVISQMPQLIGLISSNGKVLKKISYSRDLDDKKILMTIPQLGQRPFFIGDTLFLSQFYRADESAGILTPEKQKHSYLNAKINLKTEKCQLMSLVYPEELIGCDIFSIYISRVVGFNGCFVYNFSIINGLFISNDRLSFDEKKVIESNYQLELPENLSKQSSIQEYLRYSFTRDIIENIYYDRYRECYYLIIRMREQVLEKNSDFQIKVRYPHSLIIILDKKLNHMGDVYLPDDIYSTRMMFITTKGLYISEDHVNNPTFSEDYMRFRLFTLEKIKN